MRSASATLTPATTKDVAPKISDPHSTFITVLATAPVTADLDRSYLCSKLTNFCTSCLFASLVMRLAFLTRDFPLPFMLKATLRALTIV